MPRRSKTESTNPGTVRNAKPDLRPSAAISVGYLSRCPDTGRLRRSLALLAAEINPNLFSSIQTEIEQLHKQWGFDQEMRFKGYTPGENSSAYAPEILTRYLRSMVDQALGEHHCSEWYELGAILGDLAGTGKSLDAAAAEDVRRAINRLDEHELEQVAVLLRFQKQHNLRLDEILAKVLSETEPGSSHLTNSSGGIAAFFNAVANALTKRTTNAGRCLDAKTEARDKWIYTQYMKGVVYKTIIADLKRRATKKKWEPILSDNGIRGAARRYATRHGKPFLPRQKGRPSR